MSNRIHLSDLTVERGQKYRGYLPIPATDVKIPLTVINGNEDGPTLLITAGIHGGEYPGVAAAMELGRALAPEDIRGCLIFLHPVNVQAFWDRRAFIVPADGKNLNRAFPGDANGTLSQKTAHLLRSTLFPLADFYADLHSGDLHEELHPYVYYPGLPNEEIAAKSKAVAEVLDMQYMVRSTATSGAYNCAALSGLPSILIERGSAGLCPREDIDAYKSDLRRILHKLGIASLPVPPRQHSPRDVVDVIYLEAAEAGCWLPCVKRGDAVQQGQILGEMVDIFGEPLATHRAAQDGVVLYICSTLAAPKDTVLIAYGRLL